MKNLYLSFALAMLFYSCKKEQQPQSYVQQYSTERFSRYPIIGRQRLVVVPTGDRTYPTSEALLWLPVGYGKQTEKSFPLIINLYGTGQMGTDINLMLQSNTMSQYIAEGFDATALNSEDSLTYQYIVFSPQCPAPWGWSALHVKTMLQALEDSLRIDVSRIYITGFSVGGWGLWSCVTDDESLCSQFAAIVPISSAAADHPDQIINVDKYGIACWNICGDQDAFYPNAIKYTNIINSNNPPIPAVLETLKGVGHSAWVQAYDSTWRPKGQNLYEWLLNYHK